MGRGIIQQIVEAFLQAKRASNEERRAERRAANWTAGATVAMAAFTFVSIGVGVSQYLAMRGQQTIMQGQLNLLQAAQRPQIEIVTTFIKSALAFTQGEPYLFMDFNTKNLGHDPAVDATLDGVIFIATSNASIVAKEEAVCSNLKSPAAYQTFRKFTIFGDSTHTLSAHFPIGPNEIAKWKADPKYARGEPMLVGCIDYMSGQTHYQTGFIYEIDRRGGVTGFAPINPADGDVPDDQIALGNPGLPTKHD